MSPLPNRTQELPEKRYYDPSTAENWADILHTALEELSANSLVTGTDHTLFEPVDGQLFVPEDGNGRWYLGNGTDWIDLGEVGSASGGNFEGSLERVVTADQLVTALGRSNYIRIDDLIDVSGISPIEVPSDTVLFGLGTQFDTTATGMEQSSKLFDNSDNPTIRVVGDDARLFGFGISNQSTGVSASAITTEASSTEITHLDVYCGRDGIVAQSPGTGTPTRTQIKNCRALSQTGAGGSGVGIRVDGQQDVSVAGNIVAGFNTQIEAASANANIHDNHTHEGPATSISVGLRISDTRTRVTNNRIEGNPTVAGIHITQPGYQIITHNLIQTGGGSSGIHIDFADDLYLTVIQHNLIRVGPGEPSGTHAIRGDQLLGSWRASVRSNSYSGFDQQGFTTETVAAGADNAPTHDEIQGGEIVRNTDDNSIWTNLGNSVHQLNRNDGWEVLDIAEDPDSGTALSMSLVGDMTYGTFLLAGYVNGGAAATNGENTYLDININNNYNAKYDYSRIATDVPREYYTGATSWPEEVWSRYVTPLALRFHSGTEADPAEGDYPYITIHNVGHQGRRGLFAGRLERAPHRLHSIQLNTAIPRFGGRFVLYGMNRDGVSL